MRLFDKVQDSGQRAEFGTGAVRDMQVGKGRFDLIPFRAMQRLAIHFENGAVKYGDSNWLKGIPLRTYLNSAARHLWKILEGWDDEDHAAALMWNAACFLTTQELIQEGKLPKNLDNMVPNMEPPKLVANTSAFAVDCDGVFANFSQALIEKAQQMGMGDVFPKHWTEIPSWDLGVTADELQKVWKVIEKDMDFWVNLEPMQTLPFTPLAYVSARPLLHITEAWLFKHGFPSAPVVIVKNHEDKVRVLNELGAKIYIDDKYENYVDIRDAGFISFLQDRPWNREFEVGDDRVSSVSEAVEKLLDR